MKIKSNNSVCVCFLLLVFTVVIDNNMSATVFTSTVSGSYTVAATWAGGVAPALSAPGDTVIIASGDTVNLVADTELPVMTIDAGGVLNNAGFTLTFEETPVGADTTLFTINGEYTGTGVTKLVGFYNINTITGTGLIATTGDWDITGDARFLPGSMLTVTNSNFNVQEGSGTVQILCYGSITFANGSINIGNATGYAQIICYGSITLTNGSITTMDQLDLLENHGTITLTNGDINIGNLSYNGNPNMVSAFCTNPQPNSVINYGVITVGGNITGVDPIRSLFRNMENATLNIAGTLLPFGTGRLIASCAGNTVNYNGSGNQTIKRPYTSQFTYWHLKCSNKGIKTLEDKIVINGNLTIRDTAQLDVTGSNYNVDIKGNWYDSSTVADPFLEQTGTVTFSGDSAQVIVADSVKKETFYNLVLNDAGVTDNDLNVLTLHDSITVLNTFTLSDGVLNLNKNVLTITNKADTALIGGSDTSYIQSEDLTGFNQSRVQWNIQDTSGYYIIPFGVKKGVTDYYIPFVFNIATKGVETTGGTGNISISTYATPTSNIPYPQLPNLVTHAYNPANAVDRFWQIDVNNYTLSPTADLTFNYPDPEKPLAGDTLVAQRWNANTALWDVPVAGQVYVASMPTVSGRVVALSVNTFSPWTLARKTNYLQCPPIALTTNTSLCYGIQQNLSADTDPDNFYSLVWSPATGLSSSTGYSVVSTLGAGTITYTLSGTETGNCYDSKTVTIDVKPLPTITGTSNTSLCYAVAAPLSVTGGISYTWSPATYLDSPTGSNITFSLESIPSGQAPVGTISYTVTGYNEYGCANTHTLSLTVNPLPTVNITPIQPICFGDTVTLNATGTGGDYAWQPDAYFVANTGDVVKVAFPAVAGTYTCSVTLVDGNNCSASDTSVAIVVTALTADAGQDVSMVCGTTTTLSGSGGSTFAWSPATGISSSSSSSVQFNLSTPGSYTYSLVVASGLGCQSTPDEVIVTVANITANAGLDVSICTGSSADLNGTGGQTYTWLPETGLSSSGSSSGSAQFNLSTPGYYSYTLTASSGMGCESTDSVIVTVIAFPTVNAGADVTVRPNSINSHDTLNVSGNAALYSWIPGVCNNCLSVVVAPTATTQYIITASNGACSVSDTVVVFYVPYECNIFVPNAFSPNGDFQNDSIKVNSYCILKEGFAFRIFDRWGTMVFQTYTQDKAWDGKYENLDIASGTVFVYTINGTNINNDAINEKGNISLVR